jgi:uncharacterized protein YjbI with pentapeptide repeats
LHDVAVRESVADMSVWRFAKLERVEFTNCRLAQSDWNSAELKHVSFVGCDLTDADFNHAQLDAVSFATCNFDGIRGVTGLRGATVDAANLVDLTVPMAAALGIDVSMSDPSAD